MGGIAVLVVLIAVAATLVWRQSDREASAFQEGQRSVDSLAAELAARFTADSTALVDSLMAWQDSLAMVRLQLESSAIDQRRVDSLTTVISDREEAIDRLETSLATVRSEYQAARAENERDRRDQEALDYYRSRIERLPSDLSAYERRVALTEISQEVQTRFRLSTADLTALQNKLNLQ